MKIKNSVIFTVTIFISVLFFNSCENENNKVPDVVTFNEHIAPIIFQNCSPCHSEGEAGPFILTDYESVKRKGKTILKVIEEHYMPPWPADTLYSRFLGEKKISPLQKKLLAKWIETEMQKGEGTEQKYQSLQSNQKKRIPDLVLKMDKPFFIKGTNEDHFITMKFPFELPENKYVDFIEFVPDNKKLLHHVNTHLISFDENKKQNVKEGADWIDHEKSNLDSKAIHDYLGLLQDDKTDPVLQASVSNYLPGMKDIQYPNGIGGYIFPKKGALYVNDIHYGPSPIDTFDNSYFNIYFSNTPPKRPLKEFQLGTLGKAPVKPALVVPPGEIDTFTIEYKLQEDISILTIVPHMHLIGKYYEAYAVTPNKQKIPLIKITNWHFRWQYAYTFPTPVHLPLGTKIFVLATMDNTANNPLNPFDPPQLIMEKKGSMRTTDEMLQCIIVYVPYQVGDEKILLNTK